MTAALAPDVTVLTDHTGNCAREWAPGGDRYRVALDRLGRRNARSGVDNAATWLCRDLCGAVAAVRDEAVARLIVGATG